MTPVAVVSVLAIGQLVAFAVIAVLVLVCIHLYNARRRKVRQVADLRRELEVTRQLMLTAAVSNEARRAQPKPSTDTAVEFMPGRVAPALAAAAPVRPVRGVR